MSTNLTTVLAPEPGALAAHTGHGHTATAYADGPARSWACTCGRSATVAATNDATVALAAAHLDEHREVSGADLLSQAFG